MPNTHLTMLRRRSVVLAFAITLPLGAQVHGTALPADRVARIDRALQGYADRNEIAGAVALVMRDGKVYYEKAVGWADKEAGRRMTPDAIFRIASQSKAITSAAVLILVEEGKIGLNDPVGRYIPTFAKTNVVATPDQGRPTVPAKRAITITDLLTHTAGISYGTDSSVAKLYGAKGLGPAAGFGYYTADKDEPICTSMERLGTLPFVAQPGEAFVYGYNTDILGCIVERASGLPLDEFIRTRITQPLRMTDTHFFLPPEKKNRLTAVYGSKADGTVERAPNGAKGQGHYVEGPRMSFAGGAGLLSTARDYARFLQMVLNGGALEGARILAPHTVQLMTTNQVGTLLGTKGQGFGFGFEVTERYGADGMNSVGSFGWGGAYGTTYRADPKERLVIILMIQMIPNGSTIADRFPNLVYQTLVTPR